MKVTTPLAIVQTLELAESMVKTTDRALVAVAVGV
jgi:hypothetical protein